MGSLGSSLAFARGQWRPVGKHYARLAYSGRATSRSRQPPSRRRSGASPDHCWRGFRVGYADWRPPPAARSGPQLRRLNSVEIRSATRRAASSHSERRDLGQRPQIDLTRRLGGQQGPGRPNYGLNEARGKLILNRPRWRPHETEQASARSMAKRRAAARRLVDICGALQEAIAS